MNDMMSEMAATLARRRAAAEAGDAVILSAPRAEETTPPRPNKLPAWAQNGSASKPMANGASMGSAEAVGESPRTHRK